MNGSTAARGGEHPGCASRHPDLCGQEARPRRGNSARPRCHLDSAPWSTHSPGRLFDEPTPASLFDVARIVYRVDPAELKHPLCFYIPKSESAEEALWWRMYFRRWLPRVAGRGITSSAWRWSSPIRSPSRWKNFCTTWATTSLA